jgi:hypothetical protein
MVLKTNKKIRPKIILSRQGKLAFKSLINMLNILESRNVEYFKTDDNCKNSFDENKLLKFIIEYYKLPIFVFSKEINGRLYSDFEFNLPVQIPKISYLNSEEDNKNKLALGSAMNFQRRLLDHMNSFNNHRVQENLHKFTQNNGGINSLTWGPLVITPNFYKLFLSLNPNYICSKGELQILIALTQFMPRVLEQVYLDHYEPELNRNKLKNYQVIFNFLN